MPNRSKQDDNASQNDERDEPVADPHANEDERDEDDEDEGEGEGKGEVQ